MESPQTCLRHVVVTIPREEVERYLQKEYDGLVPEAQVPGFRAGRAPRKLVEKQFKDRVLERVKGALLMDSLSQVTDDAGFSAISEPDFDYESIDLPEDGDFRYEFSVEVRPEFETPSIDGLKLERAVEDISDEAVTESLYGLMSSLVRTVATDQPAQQGDRLLITATFKKDDKVVSEMDEERVELREQLTFSDGKCPDFGSLMAGVKEGETRTGKVVLADGIDDEELRGSEVEAAFHVVEVERYKKPELTETFLEELGDFESEEELRDFVRGSLQRQSEYRQNQSLREQIVAQLTSSVDFELPPELVKRQTRRELERKILELRRSGFPEEQIRNYVNMVRQNAQASTEAALREHFVLEKIAEEREVDAEESDFEEEIELIAEQSNMSTRRVRARLEKSGQIDALRNQIIERKVIEMITEKSEIKDVPAEKQDGDSDDAAAVYHYVLGTKDDSAIPAAKYDESGSDEESSKKDD
ncbi:MAG: trigger factor [Maioricimonas sp. JB049]